MLTVGSRAIMSPLKTIVCRKHDDACATWLSPYRDYDALSPTHHRYAQIASLLVSRDPTGGGGEPALSSIPTIPHSERPSQSNFPITTILPWVIALTHFAHAECWTCVPEPYRRRRTGALRLRVAAARRVLVCGRDPRMADIHEPVLSLMPGTSKPLIGWILCWNGESARS